MTNNLRTEWCILLCIYICVYCIKIRIYTMCCVSTICSERLIVHPKTPILCPFEMMKKMDGQREVIQWLTGRVAAHGGLGMFGDIVVGISVPSCVVMAPWKTFGKCSDCVHLINNQWWYFSMGFSIWERKTA